jgi:hypothetical protein
MARRLAERHPGPLKHPARRSESSRAINVSIATNITGARVRLTSSPSAIPETTIAPTMSPARAIAAGMRAIPDSNASAPTISSDPIAYENALGSGSP